MTIEIMQIDQDFQDWQGLLALVLDAFDYMHPLIDPPSSALKLTEESLREKAASEIAFGASIDGRLVGCLFCRQENEDTLYLGKLAVLPGLQGRGIGRAMLKAAEGVARACGTSRLRLETRIELTDNHKRFASWGFVKTADKAHPGYDHTTFIEMSKLLT